MDVISKILVSIISSTKIKIGNIKLRTAIFLFTGLYLHMSGILGASPDRISQKYSLEIKCPYSLRDSTDLKASLKTVERSPKKKASFKTCVRKKKLPKGKTSLNEDKPKKINSPKKYIVSYNNDGTWTINQNHEYYHQIQAQLHFTNKEVGLLFIWTSYTCELVEIDKDPLWACNIDKLLNFYVQEFFTYISHNPEADLYDDEEFIDDPCMG